MRRVLVLAVVLAVVLALAGCSSSTSKPAAAPTGQAPAVTSDATSATPSAAPSTTTEPTTAAPSTSSTCHLPDKGDIIAREKVPGLPVDAIELGGTDPEHCTWTFDMLKTSQPTGAGYCTEAAWASDNPGYDVEAKPAAPLKNVQVVIGDCG